MVQTRGWTESFDGTEVFFEVFGTDTGRPPFILADGIGCAGYVWKYLARDFGDRFQFIHYHYRGHGQSKMPVDRSRVGIPDLVEDLHRVLKRVNARPGILMGHSMGVQVILEFAHEHPELTAGVVPLCGSYGNPLNTFHDTPLSGVIFSHLKRVTPRLGKHLNTFWRLALPTEFAFQVAIHTEINGDFVKKEDFFPYLGDLSQVDPHLFIDMLDAAQGHTTKEHLTSIQAPTLVVGGEHDGFTPVWLSKEMARLLPHAEIMIMPGCSHSAPIEMPELLTLRLEKWLNEHHPAPKAPPAAIVAPAVSPKKSAAPKEKAAAQATALKTVSSASTTPAVEPVAPTPVAAEPAPTPRKKTTHTPKAKTTP